MNDLSQKRELHDAAKDLLDDKAFAAALLDLRKRWFDELIRVADTTERKLELLAQIKALEAIPGELAVLMNDFKMAAKRQGHG